MQVISAYNGVRWGRAEAQEADLSRNGGLGAKRLDVLILQREHVFPDINTYGGL